VLGGTTNIIVSMQEVAPARMRATFVALLFMIIGLIGLGIGPVGVPLIAAWLSPTGGRLGEAIAGLSIIMVVPSLLLLAWVRRRYAEQARLGFPVADDDVSRS